MTTQNEFFTVKLSDFIVIRSDVGDGGWSIHWRHHEDDDGMPSQILTSGTAHEKPNGDWDRPNDTDFATAIETLFRIPR